MTAGSSAGPWAKYHKQPMKAMEAAPVEEPAVAGVALDPCFNSA